MKKHLMVLGVFSIFSLGCSSKQPVEPTQKEALNQLMPPPTTFKSANYPVPAFPLSRYAGVLTECTYFGRLCSLGELPLLGQEYPTGTLQRSQILERLLISHDWMKKRFEAALEQMPDSTLALFRPITSIIVTSEIRPASYKPLTAAIYFDAQYLCLTKEECDTVTEKPDYRLKFMRKLGFRETGSYVDFMGAEKSAEQVAQTTIRVLYHELAHANDFISPENFSRLNQDKTLDEQTPEWITKKELLSDKVVEKYGSLAVSDPAITNLANIAYMGKKETPEDIAVTPEAFVDLFEKAKGVSFYSFVNAYEDLAINTENLLRECLHKAKSYEAILTNEHPDRLDNTVVWREFSRIFKPEIKERALFVIRTILPELNLDNCRAEQNESFLSDYSTNILYRIFSRKS